MSTLDVAAGAIRRDETVEATPRQVVK